MTKATVTVSFVNQPKEGKKQGSIKTKDNALYGVFENMLGQFQPGSTYEIEYDSREWQGKTFHTVKSAKQVAAATNGAAPAAGGRYDNVTAERIYVCGLLNAFASGGQLAIDKQQIRDATNIIRAVWQETFGGVMPKPTAKEEMDDEIPF